MKKNRTVVVPQAALLRKMCLIFLLLTSSGDYARTLAIRIGQAPISLLQSDSQVQGDPLGSSKEELIKRVYENGKLKAEYSYDNDGELDGITRICYEHYFRQTATDHR